MIVTTPEKWDVITRKSSDMSLSMLVKLLIIDEVHLLNDDRGSVIEALVARTLRQVSISVACLNFQSILIIDILLLLNTFANVNFFILELRFDEAVKPLGSTHLQWGEI